jgi:hypothetical protein
MIGTVPVLGLVSTCRITAARRVAICRRVHNCRSPSGAQHITERAVVNSRADVPQVAAGCARRRLGRRRSWAIISRERNSARGSTCAPANTQCRCPSDRLRGALYLTRV